MCTSYYNLRLAELASGIHGGANKVRGKAPLSVDISSGRQLREARRLPRCAWLDHVLQQLALEVAFDLIVGKLDENLTACCHRIGQETGVSESGRVGGEFRCQHLVIAVGLNVDSLQVVRSRQKPGRESDCVKGDHGVDLSGRADDVLGVEDLDSVAEALRDERAEPVM